MKLLKNNEFVQNFGSSYTERFSTFIPNLTDKLVNNYETLNVQKIENEICNDIFERLNDISLIDKYEAYQLLDEAWKTISVDLEILQTEGIKAANKVDPNMVTKKKNNKDVIVQEGWLGHVIPFELVQKELLLDKLNALTENENKLSVIASQYEILLEEFSEDDKQEWSNCFNEDNSAFVGKEIGVQAKKIKKSKEIFSEDSNEFRIIKVYELIEEEKALKKVIKTDTATLHNLTKETIENLSENQIKELLYKKWISPLMGELVKLPELIVSDLTSKVQELKKKYECTFAEIEQELHETEKALSAMIDSLTGNEFDMKGLSELQALLGE